MKTIVYREPNYLVTDYYLDLIEQACAEIEYCETAHIIASCFKLYKMNAKNKYIYWIQGIAPEESFLRNHSRIRSFIISLIEKRAIKKANFFLFVSDYMRIHLERKYRIHFTEDSYYVMPCFNSKLVSGSFKIDRKYSDNIFAYVGSMASWQCVDAILDLYEKIETYGLKNCQLRIYTLDKEGALEKIKKHNIRNYIIASVQQEKMNEALSDVKYGFIIREDIELNRVATPTKISNYLSNGVIPIYSECLQSFHDYVKKAGLQYVIEEKEICQKKFKEFEDIDGSKVLEEYRKVFSDYYSEEYHRQNIKNKLEEYFNVFEQEKNK